MNKQELIEYCEYLKGDLNKFINGIDVNKIIKMIEQLDEPQKVTVPQFVADWYEERKDDLETALFRCVDIIPRVYEDGELNRFQEWFIRGETKPFQTLVNMHQFGYTVEKEKRYIVKVKGVEKGYDYLNHRISLDSWFFSGESEPLDFRTKHTRKELEEAGFGEVFNSPLFEVEEVTE